MINEIDFNGYLARNLIKAFRFLNTGGTPYDFTTSTSVVFKLYKTDIPLEITGSISVSTSTVSFSLLSSIHTNELGNFEYVIEDNKSGGEIVLLGRGNMTIDNYLPFSKTINAYLSSEIPNNMVLSSDYINQRLFYWRSILQNAFSISDTNLNIESAWPELVNLLFAKLIVYDALILASKNSLIAFLGGTTTTTNSSNQGGVKRIETGPTNVEFFPVGDVLESIFKPNAQGTSVLDIYKEDLCGLADFLKVKLPMSKPRKVVIGPRLYKNPNWSYITLSDTSNITDNPVSQG